jgi:uncharacterized protein
MKKLICTIIVVFILTISLVPVAFANEPDLALVVDAADILTFEQWERLLARAEAISHQHRCDVIIITIDEMTDDDGAYEWAIYIYEEYNYGYGVQKSGILLFLSMAERDYALIAYGFGNTAFTDHGKNVMLDRHILPLHADNRYYEAFNVYLDKADEYLAMARAGNPFDKNTDNYMSTEDFLYRLAAVIILPSLLAIFICHRWQNQMKTAVKATTAHNYIPANGFRLTGQSDNFLYRTTTQTKIENNNTSRSGGTTKDSRGYSGRSGKF